MLRIRNFCAPALAQAFSTFAYMGGYILTPLLLETQFHMSVSRASLFLLARPIAFCIGAPVTSRISVLTPRRAAIGGTILMATALPVFALGAGLLWLSMVVAGNILAGFGNGMSQPAITTSVVNAVTPDRHATASGILQMMGQVGAVAGITVAGAIVASGSGAGHFTTAFLVATIPACLGVVAAWFILSVPARESVPAGPSSALETATEQA
jgi:predicted MFS family arabinose efflux permease